MTVNGTQAYHGHEGLPAPVAAAVQLARRMGFEHSCLPFQGALLNVLAAGVSRPDEDGAVIGETGTGCGVGLAWLACGAGQSTRLISVERDGDRAAAARGVFVDDPRVTVLTGDWTALRAHAPFDLLVLDGGGKRPDAGPPVEPEHWLRPGGLLVLDDFTPAPGWPPIHDGAPDATRLHWLRHPRLLAAEIRLGRDAATIVATYPGPGFDGAMPGRR